MEEIRVIPGGVSAVAKHLGKARNTVYNWCEKGNIPLDQLIQLASIGVDVQYVLTGESVMQEKSLKPEEEALLDNYRNSSEDSQRILRETSAALAQQPGKKRKTG
uniref:Bacteriophage CI repressor helix-turn-helix domain-containing protein n=1 Tax=Candidatus Kentrum sp. UNK TaxID=2126344 RepID=A0A451B6B7_9GAMM|nr:MAG: Bacteriophage CI repressor helix-turn-helix domain-containing protein [Candidatus Kentron sp. UNK]VFK73806.1 MAG: Bacteriophage CI repressor helix-turn-helix domain-containing protein [Candidatus Kentron sp. UNK]